MQFVIPFKPLLGTSYVQRRNQRGSLNQRSGTGCKAQRGGGKSRQSNLAEEPNTNNNRAPTASIIDWAILRLIPASLVFFSLAFLPKCSRRDIHSYRCVSIVSVLRAKGNAARGLSSTQPAQISLHIGPIPPQLRTTQPNSTPTNPTMP